MGRTAFYDQPLRSYGSFSRTRSAVSWIKRKYNYKKDFETFFVEKQVSTISKKYQKLQFQTQWL